MLVTHAIHTVTVNYDKQVILVLSKSHAMVSTKRPVNATEKVNGWVLKYWRNPIIRYSWNLQCQRRKKKDINVSYIPNPNITSEPPVPASNVNKGVGEGGAGGGHVPPHFQKWGGGGTCLPTFKSGGGAQVGLCPPPHFWAEQIIDMNSHFCLVFTAPEKWRVELRAKTGHYRNRCFHYLNIFCG